MFPAGERVVGELAPELVPMLASLQMPANFVPVTNDVLSEMQRRGISRDKLLTTLQLLGAEMPYPVVRMLQWAKRKQVDVKVLSDCNTVFIGHILTGAKVHGCITEVITNNAVFERIQVDAGPAPGLTTRGAGMLGGNGLSKSASHRLVIAPRHGQHMAPHECALCPSNLCKGSEVTKIMGSKQYKRIVFCGDGANDICPALSLGTGDVVVARTGHALAGYIQAAAADPSARQLQAQAFFWETHEQLAALVQEHARC